MILIILVMVLGIVPTSHRVDVPTSTVSSQVSDGPALPQSSTSSPRDFSPLAGDLPASESISVGYSPGGAAFDSSTGYVYVTGSNISVIDGTSVIASIPVGGVGAVFDPANGYVYVTNDSTIHPAGECPNGSPGCVFVISGTSIVASIPVGSFPRG
ncbi:MAG: hypothetical protein WB788_04935, partial [Thermoplasmata archaeon]